MSRPGVQRESELTVPRPHEDRINHTLVDHAGAGLPISFALHGWCAIDVASVTAERSGAAIAAYETLVEKARTAPIEAGTAVLLRSVDRRRVVTLLQLGGHDAFRRLEAAWDDHHLRVEHRAVAERASLKLYRLAGVAGDATIDPQTRDAYAFEHVSRALGFVTRLLTALESAGGFCGALVFGGDDGTSASIVYRFEHFTQIDVFRAGTAAIELLGATGSAGESFAMMHPVKTFGV